MWEPEQYLKFEQIREKPFYDLMGLCKPKPGMRILDLGCGTGTLTKVLHEKFDASKTLGIDSSQEMLAKAPVETGLQFVEADICTFPIEGKYDLIMSNAALHWIKGHETLFEHFLSALNNDGQFAVQVPSNFDFPTHRIAKEVAEDALFKTALKDAYFPAVLTIEEYSTLLHRLGVKEQVVRAEIYPMLLPSAESAVEFVKGSLLTFYRTHLSKDLYQEFLKRYTQRIQEHFGRGPVYVPFKRILMWAEK